MFAVGITDLTKDYAIGFLRKRPRRALDKLNLQVAAGEVFGLLGPNGAGKSTTLKLLLRLIFPSSGTARILGKDLDDVSMHARIGYLPEQPYFYDHLTARELLNYAAALFGMAGRLRQRRVVDLLDLLGLSDSGDIPLRKFSKGMIQRVGIAQALINDPEVVFLDEPMSGLDPLGRREVRDLILDLKNQGKTVFFSTHILSDAEMLCDRVAILDRGRLQGCGELREILSLGVSATEIVLDNPSEELLTELQGLAARQVKTGGRVRLEIADEKGVSQALETILRAGARIVSLNPVKMSLEDYFMARVGEAGEQHRRHGEMEITAGGKR
jgi:ABC-2 type transport system ATP-binding protein